MEKKLCPMIFKRKSFHIFKDIGSIRDDALTSITLSTPVHLLKKLTHGALIPVVSRVTMQLLRIPMATQFAIYPC